MKALVVMSDASKAVLTCGAFAQADFNVQLAESALYALTMLERDKPDVIVSESELSDMSGLDLLELVRDDRSLDAVGFLLLSEVETHEAIQAPKDALLHSASSAQEIVEAAGELTKAISSSTDSGRPQAALGSRQGLSGTLEVFTLLQLLQSLHQQSKTGTLHLNIPEGQGSIVFYQGQLIHANVLKYEGSDAVRQLVMLTKHHKHCTFSFESQSEHRPPSDVVSISKRTDRFLLDLALEKSGLSI